MKIVGQVHNKEEAHEFEEIARVFVVNNRIRKLATQSRGDEQHPEPETVMIP
jgi:hypothetical protein